MTHSSTAATCLKAPNDSHFFPSLLSILDSLRDSPGLGDLPDGVTQPLLIEGSKLLLKSFCCSCKYLFTSKSGKIVKTYPGETSES